MLFRLNEWREFEVYHQCKADDRMMSTWRLRQALARLFEEEATSDREDTTSERAAVGKEIRANIESRLDVLFSRQLDFEASLKQLACIELQGLEMLSEASASLEGSPLLCQQFEKKMEDQTNGVYRKLGLLKARPSRSPQAPSTTAPFTQRILHWKSETSRLYGELREWKIFLKWRRNQANPSTSTSTKEQESNGRDVDLALWIDFVAYQQSEVDKARSWVGCWQRLQKSAAEEIQDLTRAGLPTLGGTSESIRKYIERFQQDVRTAEARLRSAQQQLADLSLQQSPSAALDFTPESSRRQQSPPGSPDLKASGSRFNDPEHLHLEISSAKAHRRPPTTHGSSGSVHASKVSSPVGETRAEEPCTDKGPLIAISDAVVPDQVRNDDDTQMRDAADRSCPHEVIGVGEGTEPIETDTGDVEDPVNKSSCPAPKIVSQNTDSVDETPLPIHQVQTSRKTRSAADLDCNRVLKKKGKKQAKTVKTFTEEQRLALLNAASTSDPPTDPIPLRRSERLTRKAEVRNASHHRNSNLLKNRGRRSL